MERVVRGHNWYFDVGTGSPLNCWRVLDEVELPELNFSTDDFAPSGHFMGVSWPEDMAPLKATIKLKTDDERVRSLCGRQPGDYLTMTHYENLRSYRDGKSIGRIITIKGLMNSVKPDTRKGVKSSGTAYEISTVVTYQDVYNDRVIHLYDFFAGPGVTLLNGANPFADMAQNLALNSGVVL